MAEFSADSAALVSGLHSVTFFCGKARANNRFWTEIIGLRRVKQTVDCDSPDCYRLYYGNESGAAGTLVSACLLPQEAAGKQAAHKAPPPRRIGDDYAVLAARKGALPFWRRRLEKFGIAAEIKQRFGAPHLCFRGPCGEYLELTENAAERRPGCRSAAARGIAPEYAVCGLHSLSLAVWNKEAAADFLTLLGYRRAQNDAAASRFVLPRQSGNANGARIIDLEQAAHGRSEAAAAKARLRPGALSRITFAAAADLAALQEIFLDKGYKVGGLKDNVYYSSFYLYAPQGAAVEMAAAAPGFAEDETEAGLGAALCLPRKLEHLRHFIETRLEKLSA